jgi:hypothetical protein
MARTGKNAEPRPPASRQNPKRGAQEQREARWRRLSRQWEVSGLTQREFCQQQKVSLASFGWWRCELARRDRARAVAPHPDNPVARKSSGGRCTVGDGAKVRRQLGQLATAGLLPTRAQANETSVPPPANHFIPVQLMGASFSAASCPPVAQDRAALEVLLASGHRIRIPGDFDASLLQKLIAVLEACPC